MKKTNPILFITVAVLALLAGAWFGVTRQSLRRREMLLREIDEQQSALASFNSLASATRSIVSASPESEKSLATDGARLSTSGSLSSVLAEIWQIAAKNSLQTHSTRPLPEKRILNYVDQEIELSLTGTPRDLQEFLRQIEGMPRAVRIDNLNLAVAADPHQSKLDLTLAVLLEPTTAVSRAGLK